MKVKDGRMKREIQGKGEEKERKKNGKKREEIREYRGKMKEQRGQKREEGWQKVRKNRRGKMGRKGGKRKKWIKIYFFWPPSFFHTSPCSWSVLMASSIRVEPTDRCADRVAADQQTQTHQHILNQCKVCCITAEVCLHTQSHVSLMDFILVWIIFWGICG